MGGEGRLEIDAGAAGFSDNLGRAVNGDRLGVAQGVEQLDGVFVPGAPRLCLLYTSDAADVTASV